MKSLSLKHHGIFLITAVFALSLFPACNDDSDDDTTNGNGETEIWEPYQVQPNTAFSYDYEKAENNEIVATGNFDITVGDPEVEISGTVNGEDIYVTNNNSSDVTENFESAITMTQTTLLYQPFWANAFAGEELEVGNYWSYAAGGQSYSFEVTGTATYAGIEGYVVEIVYDDGSGNIQTWEACINKSVPLALMTDIVDNQVEYYFELTNYEE